jgi:hypothetical protein
MNHELPPRLTHGPEPLAITASLSRKRDERVDYTMEFARTFRIYETLTIIIKDNIWLTKTAALSCASNENGGVSPAVWSSLP